MSVIYFLIFTFYLYKLSGREELVEDIDFPLL